MYNNVWIVLPNHKDLVSPYELYQESQLIQAAQPFTVSMVTVVVAEDLDGILRGENDILILTRSSLGEQPFVERIHFYEEEIPHGKPIGNLFADTVYTADDYSGFDRLWLELNILEIDTDTGERKVAMNAFQSLAATTGAVFPILISHTFVASAVANVITKLCTVLEKNTNVIRVPFALHPGEVRPGKAPFQFGTYIVFSQPQNPEKFKLESDGTLTENGNAANVSYAVFNIAPQKQVNPTFVMSQKIATLLTQINTGNENSAKKTIEFLNDTLTEYSNFTKLKRYLQIQEKVNPTEEEKALMEEIKKIEALKPFLPKE